MLCCSRFVHSAIMTCTALIRVNPLRCRHPPTVSRLHYLRNNNEQMLEQIWWCRCFFFLLLLLVLVKRRARHIERAHHSVCKWRCKTSKCLLINGNAFNWIWCMAPLCFVKMEKIHSNTHTHSLRSPQILFENVKHSTLCTDKYQIHFMANVRREERDDGAKVECEAQQKPKRRMCLCSRFKMLPLSISLKIFIVIYFCH